jgi:replicative DNA helicase
MVTSLPPPHLLETPDRRASGVRSVRDALQQLLETDRRPGRVSRSPIATGFDLLDRVLDGGIQPHDLVLLGGSPGVGKTVAGLQMARHVAQHGRTAIYVSYEHDDRTMLGRLLALQLGEMGKPGDAPEIDRLRGVVVEATSGFRSLDEVIQCEPLVAKACDAIDSYADRLLLVRGSGAHTDLAAIESLVEQSAADHGGVLFVDYLQKVAVNPDPENEAEKVTKVAEGLKDLSLSHDLAVVALVAADWEGLRAGRVRLHHLRGSSALAYEADVAIILSDKHRAVARSHLAYDSVKAEKFKQWVVFSVEKNRGGVAMVDLEFRKDFLHYRFDPRGSYMAERSVDDRLEPSG